MPGDDLARRGWRLLDGVGETPSAYRFEPLGIVIPKGSSDTEARLRASGMVSRTGPWWSPVLVRSRCLPCGRVRALGILALHYGRSLLPVAIVPAAVAVAGLSSGARGTLAVGLLGLMVVLSLLVHEAGHVLALRWVGRCSPAILTTRGADAALVRPPFSGRLEVIVVCAGPGAPLLLGIPLLLLWQTCWPFVVAWFAVSAAHLAALAIPVGDGANLRDALGRLSASDLGLARRG